ncbi:Uncharacterised protein [Segatella copri]|nr:Uncharacterised protein [Segatella copri]
MTFESQTSICFRHTFSIIYHLDVGTASIGNCDMDIPGTRIDCIFDQLLNN